MNKQIITWLNGRYGYNISAEYYKTIDIWLDWWRGYYKPFHRFWHNNGKKALQRDIFTLKMGKKVCEDWASILLNSKTKVKIDDPDANKFVQGENETGGVFGSNSFWVRANRLIERAFASGTGAVTIHLTGVNVADGSVQLSPDARIKLNYISAEMIIPLSEDNGKITEVAFVSASTEKSRKYLLLEVHRLNGSGHYVIENFRFSADNDVITPVPLPENQIGYFDTKSSVPWFAIYEPNLENDIEYNNGLGISVLHGAIDALKAVDLCFNNFVSDFYLGQKKVFMEKSLIEITDDGTVVAPDDVNQQLFTYVEFPDAEGGQKFISEFNPSLRAEENTKGIQSALDYLSFKVGLGNKHYQFNSGSIVTATQYTGDKQDLIQNAHKHYIPVEEFMLSLIRSIVYIGKNLIGYDLNEDCKIEITFDKSVIIDEAAERENDRSDVREKLMTPWEYRMKWYGETEEEAKKMADELSEGEQMYGGEGDFE